MPKTVLAGGDVLAMFANLPALWQQNVTMDVRLYTAQPSSSGDPTINEATYTGYVAQAVAVGQTGIWSRDSNRLYNNASIVFPINTGAPQTITHVGLGYWNAGHRLAYWGQLTNPLVVGTGQQPTIPPNAVSITEY